MKKELLTLVKITVSVFKSPCQVVHVSPSFTGTASQLCVVLVSALSVRCDWSGGLLRKALYRLSPPVG